MDGERERLKFIDEMSSGEKEEEEGRTKESNLCSFSEKGQGRQNDGREGRSERVNV